MGDLRRLSASDALRGKYEIIRHIGGGGMGEVYLGRDHVKKRYVAIKELSPQLTRIDGALARFLREVTISLSLEHPNVVQGIEYIDEPLKLLVTEYIDGGNLSTVLERAPVIAKEALPIITQIAEGLRAIHAAGIIHRDLKPSNVLLTQEGIVKISDFGVASLGGEHTLTRTGAVVGTAKYIPPEFFELGECDGRGDIYAWGLIAFELMTGVAPFQARTLGELIKEKMKCSPTALMDLYGQALSQDLRKVLSKALSVSVLSRYLSAEELVEDLKKVTEQIL